MHTQHAATVRQRTATLVLLIAVNVLIISARAGDLQKSVTYSMARRATAGDSVQKFNSPLQNVLDVHYDVFVTLGGDADNQRSFRLILDTGSTLTWIAAQECDECAEKGFWNRYSCADSPTCNRVEDTNVEIEYASGTIKGYLVQEEMYLPREGDNDALRVENMQLLMTTEIGQLQNLKSDGLMGLGPSYDSEIDKTILDFLVENGAIDSKVFALRLDPDTPCQNASTITFGGYDESLADTPVQYFQMSLQEYWAVQITSLSVAFGDNEQSLEDPPTHAIIDSGTTKMTLSSKTLKQVIETLGTKGVKCWTRQGTLGIDELMCSHGIKSVDFALRFRFGGAITSENTTQDITQFDVPVQDLVQACAFTVQHGYACTLRVQVLDLDDQNFAVLGEVFMKQYVTVFDDDAQRVGFAVAKKDASPTAASVAKFEHVLAVYETVGAIIAVAFALAVANWLHWKRKPIDFSGVRKDPAPGDDPHQGHFVIELSDATESFEDSESGSGAGGSSYDESDRDVSGDMQRSTLPQSDRQETGVGPQAVPQR